MSMSLQRSEQKGRQRLAGEYSLGLPHCGQTTMRGFEVLSSVILQYLRKNNHDKVARSR